LSDFATTVVFLLSSKAGNVGFNLVGSNRIVLFDPDWCAISPLHVLESPFSRRACLPWVQESCERCAGDGKSLALWSEEEVLDISLCLVRFLFAKLCSCAIALSACV
jgi:hypothetical protein